MHKRRGPEQSAGAPFASALPLPKTEHQHRRRHDPAAALGEAVASADSEALSLPP
jgi:hypothetical protein